MERYDHIGVVGAGSYGVVMKCRHRHSDQIVAIKKFLETEDDATIRKMAIREIRMLKKLKHENLVTLIEVFRYRKRFYLVFEYMAGTVLDEIEKHRGGIGKEKAREHIFQVLRALAYCHSNQIVHRDIKPENILISTQGVVKVCDFGFARVMSYTMELCTEYVATRWYRAPELLVGEQQYGAAIDVWAAGCLFAEMLNGEALFPGESDIDQLYLIVKGVGKPCGRHQAMMAKNSQLRGMINCSVVPEYDGLQRACGNWGTLCSEFLMSFLQMDPAVRPTCTALLNHKYFTHDNFAARFLPTLRNTVISEFTANPLLRRFKSEVLRSSDMVKMGEGTCETKRSSASTIISPPWKVNVTEGTAAKRKFSYDSGNLHSSGHSYMEKTGITFLKSLKATMPVPQSEISMLRKSIKNLSANSDNEDESECTVTDTTSSYTMINAKVPRKSPALLQNATQPSLKSIFSQQLGNISSTQVYTTGNVGRKLDRYSMSNMFIHIDPLHNSSNVRMNTAQKSKRKEKVKNDFTLPNLPGATTSPKDQNRNMPSETCASIITPRILSASGSPKHILPLM